MQIHSKRPQSESYLDSAKNFKLDSARLLDTAYFSAESAPSKQEANSSIVGEFLQLCEASDSDRTDNSSRKRALRNCEKSPQEEFAPNYTNKVA